MIEKIIKQIKIHNIENRKEYVDILLKELENIELIILDNVTLKRIVYLLLEQGCYSIPNNIDNNFFDKIKKITNYYINKNNVKEMINNIEEASILLNYSWVLEFSYDYESAKLLLEQLLLSKIKLIRCWAANNLIHSTLEGNTTMTKDDLTQYLNIYRQNAIDLKNEWLNRDLSEVPTLILCFFSGNEVVNQKIITIKLQQKCSKARNENTVKQAKDLYNIWNNEIIDDKIDPSEILEQLASEKFVELGIVTAAERKRFENLYLQL